MQTRHGLIMGDAGRPQALAGLVEVEPFDRSASVDGPVVSDLPATQGTVAIVEDHGSAGRGVRRGLLGLSLQGFNPV